jgi:hypothetical protein
MKIYRKTSLIIFFLSGFIGVVEANMSDLFNKYSNTTADKEVEIPTVMTSQAPVSTSQVDDKAITIKANPYGPWVASIKERLIEKGVNVKSYSSKDKTRYILHLNANAPTGWIHKCFGGGYQFDYYIAELIDSTTNKVISSVEDSGFSEGCQPLSGTMYTQTVNMIGTVIQLSDAPQDNTQSEGVEENKPAKNWN